MTAPKPGEPGFVYLNRDDAWLDFERHDLDVVDGRLMLTSRAALAPPLEIDDPALHSPEQPAGIAIAPDGAIFVTNGWQAAIARIDPCDGTISLLPSPAGEGDQPGQLLEPSGIACHPGRRALIVCDSGNGRLQLVDVETYQIIDLWAGFDRPVDCAVDAAGNVLVVDRGMREVHQLTVSGDDIPGFWDRLSADLSAAAVDLIDPVNVAISPDGAIAILDRGAGRVIFVGPDGSVSSQIDLDLPGDVLGLAVTAGSVFIGENVTSGRLIEYRRDGELVGVCPGYEGPVAGLAVGADNALLLNPGWLDAPPAFTPNAAFATIGCAVGGPFGGFAGWNKRWHSLAATIASLPATTHVTFAVKTTDTTMPPSIIDPPDPLNGYFSSTEWQLAPIDLERFLIRLPERQYAWVGVQLEGEGNASPVIDQVRLDYDVPSYLDHLPEIYREEEAHDALLARYLALVAGFFDDVETEIDELPALLDPAGTSKPWLHKLAQWLGLDISPRWNDDQLRDAIAHAWIEAAQRGTVAGLRNTVRRYSGIDSLIEEPIVQAGWWALATAESPVAEQETSMLGVSTVLVAAEPAGAILGQTATIGRSHLIPGDRYGAPLFEGLAHRFVIRIDDGLDQERLTELDAVIDREKPAHVLHDICVATPGMSAGRARIGIDSVLGGETPPARIGAGTRLGVDTVLGGEASVQLGDDNLLGISTRLRDERR